ncbi:HIT domain-containing protein [Actinomadura sp. NAK00032]|uniref:HIT domain-containing protein n=1 Tax=Actinomadura sp. NAK00032 TaxID=2742128 RepID=UPI001591A021|nr:HIT domain-containing protein [Actinomadura sp. NAK00032]QKW34825.1 HIT domain-containing protein [Actinomadura sp. NAK00032]
MGTCEFCAIAAGEAAAETVYADDSAVAFVPLHPATPGHVLVVPREHFPDIWALDADTAHRLADAVLRVAHGVRRALDPEGLNVINSSGRAATQTVFHVHVHVVPRWQEDGFGRLWPESPRHEAGRVERAVRLIRRELGGAPPR